MAKISDFKMKKDREKVDEDLIEKVESMMEDPSYEFALEEIESIYRFIEKTGEILFWMKEKLDFLEGWKRGKENENV